MDLEQLKNEVDQEISKIKSEIQQPQEQQSRRPQESGVWQRFIKAMDGVTAPELEYVLGSENILAVESEMRNGFNDYVFNKLKNDFAKEHPEICEKYIETAIKNKEEYAKLNARKIQEQAAELEKERQEKAELQRQVSEMNARLAALEKQAPKIAGLL
jgi:hypothetical protein